MQDTEFYQQVLGLSKPWRVKAVKLEMEVPWAEHFSRFTRLVEVFVVQVGLPNFAKFRTRILFYCGKLNMLRPDHDRTQILKNLIPNPDDVIMILASSRPRDLR